MRKCNMKQFIALILAFAVTFSFFQAENIANAKEKKAWYFTEMNGKKSGIKKMQLKGNKLTIWGSFGKASSSEKSIEAYQSKKLKYKKRTFVLSKKVKFYAVGGDMGASEYNKKIFKSTLFLRF